MSEQEAGNKENQTEVRVLIIAHKKNQFIQAAQFLARRGIPCAVKGNVREGVQHISKEKPFLVFLSWNLPNSNTQKTYQLITKALKTECIVFGEKSDGKTAAELNNSKIPEVMHAPVSGPGFFMRIQKLIKSKDETKNPASRTPAKPQPQTPKKTKKVSIKIKNKKEIPQNGSWEQTGVDEETGQAIYTFKSSNNKETNGDTKPGYYTFKGRKAPELKEDGTWNLDSGELTHETEEAIDDSPGIINFQNPPKYDEEDYGETTDDSSLNNIDDLINEAELSTEEMTSSEGENNSYNDLFAESTDVTTEFEAEADEKDKKNYGSVLNVAKKKKKKKTDLPDYEVTKPKTSMILGQDGTPYKANESMIIEPQVSTKTTNSILLEKTFEALKVSVRPAQNEHQLVETISKAKVLNIHSNRFRGYLIVAIPNFYELDKNVFSNIKENLIKLLKDQGEELKHFEELNVDIEEVGFKKWSEENAEFTISTLDAGQEIILSYVPQEETLPKIEEKNQSMATVKTSDITAETKTKFNLFLHLPKNNKFIKYLKPGDTVTTKHTNKFSKHSVDKLHIKKDEIHSFKEYFASNQLQKKTKKKAS